MNERLKALRTHLHLTQKDFAAPLGVTAGAITNYEKNHRNPSKLVIDGICKVYGCSRDWLVQGTGTMFPELSREEQLARDFGGALTEGDADRLAMLSVLLRSTPDQVHTLTQFALDLLSDQHAFQESLARQAQCAPDNA